MGTGSSNVKNDDQKKTRHEHSGSENQAGDRAKPEQDLTTSDDTGPTGTNKLYDRKPESNDGSSTEKNKSDTYDPSDSIKSGAATNREKQCIEDKSDDDIRPTNKPEGNNSVTRNTLRTTEANGRQNSEANSDLEPAPGDHEHITSGTTEYREGHKPESRKDGANKQMCMSGDNTLVTDDRPGFTKSNTRLESDSIWDESLERMSSVEKQVAPDDTREASTHSTDNMNASKKPKSVSREAKNRPADQSHENNTTTVFELSIQESHTSSEGNDGRVSSDGSEKSQPGGGRGKPDSNKHQKSQMAKQRSTGHGFDFNAPVAPMFDSPKSGNKSMVPSNLSSKPKQVPMMPVPATLEDNLADPGINAHRKLPRNDEHRKLSRNDEHRNKPGTIEQRKLPRNDEHRKKSGTYEQRNQSGTYEQRKLPRNDEHRNQSGNYEQRNQSGSYEQRKQSGANVHRQQPGTSEHRTPQIVQQKHTPPPAMRRYNSQNVEFYMDKIMSKPRPGYTIEEMLRWRGDYRQLEINHRYIQWLFPIPESGGMNPEAQPLHDYEAVAIRESHDCRNRLMRAYKMMLDFYGMKLVSSATGEVERCETNWKKRFAHLNKSGHNYLRISRILKALACFGLAHYQKPWIEFFLNEVFLTKALSEIRHGAVIHWIDSMDDENDRNECLRLFQDYHDNTRGLPPTKLLPPVEESDTESDDEETPSNQDNIVPVDGENSDENETNNTSQTRTINETAREKRREKQIQNLEFYRNNLKSKPGPGFTIKEMLKWKGQYSKWEGQCFYIQWLFPIPTSVGANKYAQELLPHEIKAIRSDGKLRKRFLDAYNLMLDLYGMKLKSKKTGEINRAKNWEQRYEFLESSVEDHRRITRIIESLDCFGYTNFQYPWVSFLMNEIYVQERLSIPDDSVRWWIYVMADDNDKLACSSTMEELLEAEKEGMHWNDDKGPGKNSHGYHGQLTTTGKKQQQQTQVKETDKGGVSDNTAMQHDLKSGQAHRQKAKGNLNY